MEVRIALPLGISEIPNDGFCFDVSHVKIVLGNSTGRNCKCGLTTKLQNGEQIYEKHALLLTMLSSSTCTFSFFYQMLFIHSGFLTFSWPN